MVSRTRAHLHMRKISKRNYIFWRNSRSRYLVGGVSAAGRGVGVKSRAT